MLKLLGFCRQSCRNYNGNAQQIIGREGETATFLKWSLVSLTLRVFGFAPRQLNRSTLRGEIRRLKI